MNEVTIVNVVGSGAVSSEFDLEELSLEIGSEAEYDPENYPGMYLRFEGKPTITVYRTGKFIIYGADNIDEIYETRDFLLTRLADLGAIKSPEDTGFSIQNVVCTGKLEGEQNLNAVAIQLGLDRTEYEPEQFPGLIYRPEEHNCVILIFGSGKVVITGCKDQSVAESALESLKQEIALR
ncbi:TATA-box-binding protein [Halorubrum depositum]|uniref:TATA-box-binding protein n=1 Tax=Halorubrum depositum TaxID=2583992 RepID=UPI0011A9B08C|nr:TATA-box-binding protein [Halorubrum depositum]